MKIKILIPFLMVLAFSSCKKEKKTTGELSVLSYNVAGLPEGVSGSHPVLYTSSISRLLSEFNVVHMQEDFCYHDSLLLYDTHPYRSGATGCVAGGGLTVFSDFPYTSLQRITWNECVDFDCFGAKGFTFSKLELPGGVVIDLYNIHAQAQSYPEAMEARRRNIEQLCTYINTHSAGNAVLLFGDFNSRYTRDGDTIRAVPGLGFKDVWVELLRGGELPVYGTSSLGNCDPPRTKPDCERVDKVFYRSNDNIEITPLEYMLDDPRFYYNANDTLPLSDHWPIYVKFSYTMKK